jgi:hypothetical protein
VRLKDGVIIAGLHIKMRPVLIAAEDVWRDLGRQEVVITSALDGCHSAASLHPYGRAVDLRTRVLRGIDVALAVDMLRERLGDDYDVVLEPTHIHVEYDPEVE